MGLIPVLAVVVFYAQNILGLNRGNELAIKQITYYAIFLFSCSALMFVVARFREHAFGLTAGIAAALMASLVAAEMSGIWIYGPYVVRGNLENTTVYLLVSIIVFRANSYLFLISATCLYMAFSVYTQSGQGILLSSLFLAFLALPTENMKRLMLYCVATIPFLLPAAVLLANDSVAQIDQNVDFRRLVWRQTYQDFFNGDLMVGRLGTVVNKDFVDLLTRSGIAWEGVENIGAHNFPLQLTQLFGISGLIVSIAFFAALLRMILPLANYPGIVFCFLAVVISLTLNQAEAHLLYQFGTALLIACISAAYVSADTAKQSMRIPMYGRALSDR